MLFSFFVENLITLHQKTIWTIPSVLLIFLSFSSAVSARGNGYPIWLYNDNVWNRAQIMHLQTQQQLQSQDQYRRNLLIEDQQRQIQRLQDQQYDFEFMQRNSIMHRHVDQLRMYSQPSATKTAPTKPK